MDSRTLRSMFAPAVVAVVASLTPAVRAEPGPARRYEGPSAVTSSSPTPELDADAGAEGLTGPSGASDEEPPADAEGETDADGKVDPEDIGPASHGPIPVTPQHYPEFFRRHRIIYRNLIGARINPLGMVNDLTVGYRRQLFNRKSILFRDTFVFAGAQGFFTPALIYVGPRVEVQPLAVLNLYARYDFLGTFGVLSQIKSLPSASADWGPKALDEGPSPYATFGQVLTLGGVLQAQVKQVAVRSEFQARYARVKLRPGDRVYYDQAIDMLNSNRGWAMTHDFDLAYIFEWGLTLAARHTLTHAVYRQRDFRPQEPVSQPNAPTLRLGPALLYRFFDRPGTRFNRPTLILISQWWLRHRYRTGVERHRAIPYLALAFTFEGDLLRARPGQRARRRR